MKKQTNEFPVFTFIDRIFAIKYYILIALIYLALAILFIPALIISIIPAIIQTVLFFKKVKKIAGEKSSTDYWQQFSLSDLESDNETFRRKAERVKRRRKWIERNTIFDLLQEEMQNDNKYKDPRLPSEFVSKQS